MNKRLILGSSSAYRKRLLQKLRIPFEVYSPDIDESVRQGEQAETLVERLAIEKARTVAESYADALIIGSDQVCVIDGEILGKPGNRQNACHQLTRASGRRVTFLTGLCLLNSGTGKYQSAVVPYSVWFRDLSQKQIEAYVDLDLPFNCAGSFKSEGLGIALFSKMEGEDPSALIGLPLICLVTMLISEGVDLLSKQT